jgi:hypothetical protein
VETIAFNTLQELKVNSNDGTTVTLGPANLGASPDPANPVATVTIAFASGRAPSDAVAGATARVTLSIG